MIIAIMVIILGEVCLENAVSGLFTFQTSKHPQQKFIHQMLKNGVTQRINGLKKSRILNIIYININMKECLVNERLRKRMSAFGRCNDKIN